MFMHIRIRQCRDYFNLSQEAAASQIGVTKKVIADLERGKTISPEPDNFKKIADFYKTTRSWLQYEEGLPPPYLIQYARKERGRIPIIKWTNIPEIHENPDLIYMKAIDYLDITFEFEKNIFATEIPDILVPGTSTNLFEPRTRLLINPDRKPKHGSPVLMSYDPFSEAEYVIYGFREETPCFKYAGEHHFEKLPIKAQIFGVVVARLNIFI